MKHTPGPWTNLASASRLTITNDKYIPLATCFDAGGLKPEECQANARLIAAAPNGYKLAKHIEAMADDTYLEGHPKWLVIVQEAREFLSKVEGRD